MKVYNSKAQTFLLRARDGSQMTVGPLAFAEVPDKFQEDNMFKLAVQANALQPFQTVKQGDALEEKARAPKAKKAAKKGDEE